MSHHQDLNPDTEVRHAREIWRRYEGSTLKTETTTTRPFPATKVSCPGDADVPE